MGGTGGAGGGAGVGTWCEIALPWETAVAPRHAATPEVWRRLYETNVVAPWALTTAAAPTLVASPLGPRVRVNVVAPGLVETPWTAEWHEARAMVAHG